MEERHLYLARPKTFVKALEEGIVSQVENPVKTKERLLNVIFAKYAETHYIFYFQLCSMVVVQNLQYHGKKVFHKRL